jgi:hypothetical protein
MGVSERLLEPVHRGVDLRAAASLVARPAQQGETAMNEETHDPEITPDVLEYREKKYVCLAGEDSTPGLWDREMSFIDAAYLPVPQALRDRLAAWGATYCGITPAFQPADRAAFKRQSDEGYLLAKALKQVLPDWTVMFHDRFKFYVTPSGDHVGEIMPDGSMQDCNRL